MRKRTTRIGQRVLPKMAAGPARTIAPSSPVGPTAKVPVGQYSRTRTTVLVPPSKERAMAAQRALHKASAEKQQKKANKAKQAKQGAVVNGKRLVPLSPDAMKRLSESAAFQTTPMLTPRRVGATVTSAQRAGFVMPPASEKVVWRDESEDGSMWDR